MRRIRTLQLPATNHGYGDSSAIWLPLLAALRKTVRDPVEAVLWDLPGHGTPGAWLVDIPRAAHKPHGTQPADVAEAVARFLERD